MGFSLPRSHSSNPTLTQTQSLSLSDSISLNGVMSIVLCRQASLTFQKTLTLSPLSTTHSFLILSDYRTLSFSFTFSVAGALSLSLPFYKMFTVFSSFSHFLSSYLFFQQIPLPFKANEIRRKTLNCQDASST